MTGWKLSTHLRGCRSEHGEHGVPGWVHLGMMLIGPMLKAEQHAGGTHEHLQDIPHMPGCAIIISSVVCRHRHQAGGWYVSQVDFYAPALNIPARYKILTEHQVLCVRLEQSYGALSLDKHTCCWPCSCGCNVLPLCSCYAIRACMCAWICQLHIREFVPTNTHCGPTHDLPLVCCSGVVVVPLFGYHPAHHAQMHHAASPVLLAVTGAACHLTSTGIQVIVSRLWIYIFVLWQAPPAVSSCVHATSCISMTELFPLPITRRGTRPRLQHVAGLLSSYLPCQGLSRRCCMKPPSNTAT